jgi:hypothetical protein
MAVAVHPRWSRYEHADEIDTGEPGDDDAALSGGLSTIITVLVLAAIVDSTAHLWPRNIWRGTEPK